MERQSISPWKVTNLQREAEIEGKGNNTKQPENSKLALVTSQILDINIRDITLET